MVRVRITVPGRVYHDGRIQPVGAELEVPAEFAEAWERAGVAEIVAPAPPGSAEAAVVQPEEDKERGRRRKG